MRGSAARIRRRRRLSSPRLGGRLKKPASWGHRVPGAPFCLESARHHVARLKSQHESGRGSALPCEQPISHLSRKGSDAKLLRKRSDNKGTFRREGGGCPTRGGPGTSASHDNLRKPKVRRLEVVLAKPYTAFSVI